MIRKKLYKFRWGSNSKPTYNWGGPILYQIWGILVPYQNRGLKLFCHYMGKSALIGLITWFLWSIWNILEPQRTRNCHGGFPIVNRYWLGFFTTIGKQTGYFWNWVSSVFQNLFPTWHWWFFATPLKNMSSSVGMMTFPTEWEHKIHVPNHQAVTYRRHVLEYHLMVHHT